ncbi:MAG: calcium/sodium antiporter [Parvularculaceae bacterium]
MDITLALIIAGLIVLLIAGDLLVRGAVGLATALKIPTLIVSLTIVAFGTSAPELFVSISAVMAGNAGIALGNIIGSNIANIFIVLGLPALIYPISAHVDGLARHGAIMVIATALFAGIAYLNGAIDAKTGAMLFGGIILYIAYMWVRTSRGATKDPLIDEVAEFAAGAGTGGRSLVYIVAGLVGLPLGAHLLVTNAAALAAEFGIRQEVIGLTIISIGTSLPELATVIAAAVHRKADVALGNVVGSNIFNILAVGGAAGLVGTAEFSEASLAIDIPVMAAAALIAAFYIFLRRDIGRLSGLLMCALYAGFIALIVISAGAS